MLSALWALLVFWEWIFASKGLKVLKREDSENFTDLPSVVLGFHISVHLILRALYWSVHLAVFLTEVKLEPGWIFMLVY